uniref:Uncharacterized protein LOC111122850 n=1 Tax=Crassostrea virginica TaxID=6565 RepID=A0A8B8CY71_CRAVI|nr:uncharacterized protein LOC111122850 [Crassostrea virginica]
MSSFMLLSILAFCVFPVLNAYTCDEIFSKAATLDFSHSDAEVNKACRLNLQHTEPHVLAPYLSTLKTGSLLACFYTKYDPHAPHHSEEYFNGSSHIIAICKPGAVCYTKQHVNAFERGCVDSHSSTYTNTCADDFCNHGTNADMNSIDNILSILTTTGTPTETKNTATPTQTNTVTPIQTNTATPTQTRTVTPKVESKTTTTPAHLLNPSSLTCDELFKKAPFIDFTHSNAEVNEACRLNLQHIEPHVLAPYLDLLRTGSLLACFYTEYDPHASHHSEEYLNSNSHIIAVCKPGAKCYDQRHTDAYERGCVDGNSQQFKAACATDFCNNRTHSEIALIDSVLSLIPTTSTTTTTPPPPPPLQRHHLLRPLLLQQHHQQQRLNRQHLNQQLHLNQP